MRSDMKVLMLGVDRTSVGGMLTVVENYLNDKEFCKKTNLTYIPSVINSSPFVKMTFFVKSLVKIVKSIKTNRFDIVHIHMSTRTSVWREGIIARAAKFLGCRILIHIHADIEPWFNSLPNYQKQLVKYFLNSANVIALLGYKWKPFVEHIVKKDVNIQIFYNAVSAPNLNLYDVASNKIIFLGMLTPLKGVNEMLGAFKILDSKIPKDIELNLYGADKNNNIEELIIQHGVQGRVKYCGWLTPKDKPECFKSALLSILPSYTEALPMTILETMAYGIPNIATPVGAVPEVITSGQNGEIIKVKSSEALAIAIESLISDKDRLKKYSVNAFETIQAKFTIQKHLDKALAIYNMMLKCPENAINGK